MVSLRPPNRNTAPAKAMIPSETSPEPGWPPIACAPKITPPMPSANSGRNQRDLHMVLIEHLLNGGFEVAGEGERERQRGCVALLFDRIDRLARDLHRFRELALGETPQGSQLANGVAHPRPFLSSLLVSGKVALHESLVKLP